MVLVAFASGPQAMARNQSSTALALTPGAEAIITMKDVCRLDNDETLAVLRWAATALLRQDTSGSDPDEPSTPERNGRTPS